MVTKEHIAEKIHKSIKMGTSYSDSVRSYDTQTKKAELFYQSQHLHRQEK